MNKYLLTLAIVALALSLMAEPLTPKANSCLEIAFATSRKSIQFAPGRQTRAEVEDFFKLSLEFEKAMATLGSELDPQTIQESLGEDTMNQKLIAIAADRKQRPDVYAEIERAYNDRARAMLPYKQFGRSVPQIMLSADLKAEHAQSGYRLPWEYALLKPKSTNYMERFENRALLALLTIKDEKALTTLTCIWESLKMSPQLDSETVDRRAALILNVVVGFPNEKGLTSILRCLGATSPGAEPLKSAVEASAQRIVAVSKESRNQEQWHSAIESFTSKTNTLIGGQRRVFESLQRAFATDAKESSK